MIDSDGYRPGIGIVLANKNGQLFWARRVGREAWQFPQGGISENETPEDALYRELSEEIGLKPQDVRMISQTSEWLKYRFPEYLKRSNPSLDFKGQKQIWFLLELISDDSQIKLDEHDTPEFDEWRWVSFWYPLRYVIGFKRNVYRKALKEFIKNRFFKKI